MLKSALGQKIEAEMTFLTADSVMFDAVYIPGGKQSISTLKMEGNAIQFVEEAFKHCKAIAAVSEGIDLLAQSGIKGVALANEESPNGFSSDMGVITYRADSSRNGSGMNALTQEFINAIALHRHWIRTQKQMVSV